MCSVMAEFKLVMAVVVVWADQQGSHNPAVVVQERFWIKNSDSNKLVHRICRNCFKKCDKSRWNFLNGLAAM